MSSNNNSLLIKATTWGRDTHGLFDYEAKNINQSLLCLSSDSDIVRKENKVQILIENTPNNLQNKNMLCHIKKVNGDFVLTSNLFYHMEPTQKNVTELQNKIWCVIGKGKNNLQLEYELKVGDIIKLGRVKYEVIEMKVNGTKITINDIDDNIFDSVPTINTNNITKEEICKICLFNDIPNEDSTLFRLCNCSGSIQNVHINCLKKWLYTKLSVKETKSHVVSYVIKKFNCEICKMAYPIQFKYNNIFHSLFEYKQPENGDYIILESLNQIKEGNNIKSIQVIPIEEGNQLQIGRGNDCDIRINDISVSRCHALIVMRNGRIFIKDTQSKFGTLVLIKGEIAVRDELMVQVGRTVLECSKEQKEEDNETNAEVSPKKLFIVEKVDSNDNSLCNNEEGNFNTNTFNNIINEYENNSHL